MEVKPKFKIMYSSEARNFLQRVEDKTRNKIIYNIDKAIHTLDPKLFRS